MHRSAATICHGYSGSEVVIRGSFFGMLSRTHSGHFLMKLLISREILGHHTALLARSRHRTTPWWPSRNFLRVSSWRALHTTILLPRISNPSPTAKSPYASQYGLPTGLTFFRSRHPSWQYLNRILQVGSSCWACR